MVLLSMLTDLLRELWKYKYTLMVLIVFAIGFIVFDVVYSNPSMYMCKCCNAFGEDCNYSAPICNKTKENRSFSNFIYKD